MPLTPLVVAVAGDIVSASFFFWPSWQKSIDVQISPATVRLKGIEKAKEETNSIEGLEVGQVRVYEKEEGGRELGAGPV